MRLRRSSSGIGTTMPRELTDSEEQSVKDIVDDINDVDIRIKSAHDRQLDTPTFLLTERNRLKAQLVRLLEGDDD